MKKWELIHDLSKEIVEKISTIAFYRNKTNSWYEHFEEIEKDVKKAREKLDYLIKTLPEDRG